MENTIRKNIDLKVPVSRVWQALTDSGEFGEWFKVKIEGPFAEGKLSRGHMTYPGYEHVQWEAIIRKIEPEWLFSYSWHPYAIDPEMDYSGEEPTLVEFRLEKIPTGTRLTVTESGFEEIPESRRQEALRMHDGGWAEQMKNIENHLS